MKTAGAPASKTHRYVTRYRGEPTGQPMQLTTDQINIIFSQITETDVRSSLHTSLLLPLVTARGSDVFLRFSVATITHEPLHLA